MAYSVTITSTNGDKHRYACGGATDQEALIYAGKIVETKADPADPQASVTVEKDGKEIGVPPVVRDMITKAT